METIPLESVELIRQLNDIYPPPSAAHLLTLSESDRLKSLHKRELVELLNTRLAQTEEDDNIVYSESS